MRIFEAFLILSFPIQENQGYPLPPSCVVKKAAD